ncbi:MAG TPA: hypothetical protein DDZ89_06915 [Clostridiales bacterium]|nr:hypothetical protein [Clostridiales bacterium]
MKNNSVGKHVVLVVFGLILLISGLLLLIFLPDAHGVMLTLPYICIGIGAGIFGGNLGTAIKNHHIKKDPTLAKQIEIEEKDERNIVINSRAKAKSYDLMLMVFSALILTFAFMQVDLYVVLTLVAAYLFIVFSMVFYIYKYNKEM